MCCKHSRSRAEIKLGLGSMPVCPGKFADMRNLSPELRTIIQLPAHLCSWSKSFLLSVQQCSIETWSPDYQMLVSSQRLLDVQELCSLIQAPRCILRDHETIRCHHLRLEMLASHLKVPIHKSLCTTLRILASSANCNSQIIQNYCQRLPMKVSAWQNSSSKMSGLSVAEFISISNTSRAWRTACLVAPCTCGMQRSE